MTVANSPRFVHALLGWIVSVAWLMAWPTLVPAEPVAMVTDLSGKAVVPAAKRELTILAGIEAGERVHVETGARLVAMYLTSGDEYAVTGPARVQFGADAPQSLSGAQPVKRASPLGKGGNIKIRPVGVAQAAFVMRSGRPTARIKLLSLSGTRTLDAVPEFRWQELEAGTRYRFELTDETGKTLYDSELESASLRLPESVRLSDGVSYTWEVSARAAACAERSGVRARRVRRLARADGAPGRGAPVLAGTCCRTAGGREAEGTRCGVRQQWRVWSTGA